MSNTPADLRLRTPDRLQLEFRPFCPDELVGADHPVRVVWAVVEKLDLDKFYEPIRSRAGTAGRDATDPRLLVGLWLWAATDGVGSARKLSRLCLESAPYRWLCGGVSLNHHTLSDFRVGHGDALDGLFTQVLASLVDKGLVSVSRITQDGVRVRACAGAGSFRRRKRLGVLLEEARAHVAELRKMLDDPEHSAGLSAKARAAVERAAAEKQRRVEQALAQLPGLEEKQAKLARRVSKKDKKNGKLKGPRASTTDPEARVMRMPDGGYRPAVNVQLAADAASRAIVGMDVVNAGVDTGQLEPMRQQVEQRTGGTVAEHLADGGFLTFDDVDRSAQQGLTLYVPPKPPRDPDKYGSQYEPRKADSDAVAEWRRRMGGGQAREVYKLRAAVSETVNADLTNFRGLVQLTVRGLSKSRCVVLWCALAHNLMHFGRALAG